MDKLNFDFVPGKNCTAWAFVGSRVTCNPAPTDTDRDVLVLLVEGELGDVSGHLCNAGAELCGEDYGDEPSLYPYRLGDDNYLLTEDREYFYRFLAVTGFAKEQNFMDKQARKDLFAAAMDSGTRTHIEVNYAPADPEGLF